MKRFTPIRRRSRLQRRVRVGQASRRRIQAGGVLAKGRQSASAVAWGEIKRQLGDRSGGRCEVSVWGAVAAGGLLKTLGLWRCVRHGVDPHHVLPRSKGGSDSLENLLHVCRIHHEQFDAPYIKGRLVAERSKPVDGVVGTNDSWIYPACGYLCKIVLAKDKFEARLLESLHG